MANWLNVVRQFMLAYASQRHRRKSFKLFLKHNSILVQAFREIFPSKGPSGGKQEDLSVKPKNWTIKFGKCNKQGGS